MSQRAQSTADSAIIGVALAPVHLEAVHLVPEELGGERILAQRRGELGQDDPCRVGPERAGDAGDALVGRDLEEVLVEAETPVVELLAARPPRGTRRYSG